MKRINFARNCQEGIYKLCEVSMEISAHEHADIDSEALWFSRDINSAKQRFILTKNGYPRCLGNTDRLMIYCEFPNVDFPEEKFFLDISNPQQGMFEWLIPTHILSVGNTEMIQHIYLLQPNNRVDVGKVKSTVHRSFMENTL